MAFAMAAACSPFSSALSNADPDAAGADAGAEASTRGCLGVSPDKLVFCDDFDDGGVVAWRRNDSDSQSIFGLSDAGRSAPFAAFAGIAPGPDNSADARYSRGSPAGELYAGVEVTGALRIDQGDPDPEKAADLVNLRFGSDVVVVRSAGVARRRSATVDGGAFTTLFPLGDAGAIPRGVWVPFRIRLAHGALAGDLEVGDARVSVPLLDQAPAKGFTLLFGPGEVPSGPGWAVLYDDIVVRSLP